jgi:hypothetical protein
MHKTIQQRQRVFNSVFSENLFYEHVLVAVLVYRNLISLFVGVVKRTLRALDEDELTLMLSKPRGTFRLKQLKLLF